MRRLEGVSGGVLERPDYAAQPQLAVVALIELMSRFPASRSLGLAHSIVAHLVAIGDDARLPESLRACAERVADEWRGYALLTADTVPEQSGRLLS